ncbi:hypothetical protein [Bacillus sp. AK031]
MNLLQFYTRKIEVNKMSKEEFGLYSLCEEFHKDIKRTLFIKGSPIQIARKASKKLTAHQIQQIISDVAEIKDRKGNASGYFCMLMIPIFSP